MNSKAIGIFDSGIGGLTVYKAIKKQMPFEKIVYLGDTARLPYGTKSPETIIKFSEENSKFLLSRNVKMVVIACNSSSSYAVPHLQNILDVPVLGVIDPGSEAAVSFGKKNIGVIGTSATISSGAYERCILEKNPEARIISKDCPLFVSLVEEGWADHNVTKIVVEEYLLPLKKEGIEVLVLGCTHYPVLKDVIGDVLGKDIKLIDSAETMALRVHSILNSMGQLKKSKKNGEEDEFFVTDFPERFKKVGEIFLKKQINNVQTVDL